MAETHISPGERRVVQMRRVRRDGWTIKRRKLFLATLAETCHVRMSAARAGMGFSSAYDLRNRDATFKALWDEALGVGYERLEEVLLHHALIGVNAINLAALVAGEDRDVATGDKDGAEDASEMTIAATVRAKVGSGIDATKLSPAAVQLALALLNRHRATVEGRRVPRKGERRATQEETDAALTSKLDALSRKLGVET